MSEISRGRSETHDGDRHLLHFVVNLPQPMPAVWAAVASPEGLPAWLCEADPLEPRLGGRVTLRWLNSDTEVSGRVTAWDPDVVAEYTVGPPHGRIRFHLEPGPDGGGSTVLRFTNEVRGSREYRLDCLAGWHDHFERLVAALDGHPTDWRDWTPDRWRHLRELYERDEAPWPKWVP
ncbi:SRPBCC domain-containing protein [Streptomyces sp. NK15101]|uniref:SRPBCC domain-containing protein n=1 Tax=Streptomyces sp. NK15101 TaxID=2873261 RepID=UPI001CEC8637|nr:SRPBCC domain-containing protein [Streptomyces sp. NK15101]